MTVPVPRWSIDLAAAIVVACGIAAYSNSFTDLFVGLDGKQSIRDNPHIRRLWPLSEAMSLPLWRDSRTAEDEDTRAAVARRPLLSLSLALNYQFSGLHPWGYHAVNLAIHLAAGLLLFGIVGRTLERKSGAHGRAIGLALVVALVWLVHPLQTESVTYVVQRGECMVGALLLATLYFAIRSFEGANRHAWAVAAVAACALGMGVKESQVVAPALVLLYDYSFVSGSLAQCVRRRWPFYTALVTTCGLAALFAAGGMREFDAELMARSFSVAQPRVILHYLRLALWPDDLFLYVNTTLFDVRSPADVWPHALVLLALAAATIRGLVRRRWYGFVGAWFFITLAPSSVLGTDKIQEHRMYLPLAAVVVLAVLGGDFALRAMLSRRAGPRAAAAIRAGLAAALVLALGVRTYVRNRDYHHEFTALHPADLHEAYTILIDHYLSGRGLLAVEEGRARVLLSAPDPDQRDVTFAHFVLGFVHQRRDEAREAAREFTSVVEREPDFAYAQKQLGVALREVGDTPGALAHLGRAVEIKPNFVYAHKELAVALKEHGDVDAAAERLRHALSLKPNFSEAYFELGLMARERGDRRDAAEQFRRALAYRPDFAEAHYELASLLDAGGDIDEAFAHLQEAVRWRPDLAVAQMKVARVLADNHDLEGARQHLSSAIRGHPKLADAHHELGRVLLRLGKRKQAAKHFTRALEMAQAVPSTHERSEELATLHTELGMALMGEKKDRRALKHFRRALRLRPDFAQAHTEMGILLQGRGKLRRAVAHYQHAIRLRPKFADTYKALGILLRDRGDLAGAAKQFAQAVRLQPDFADAHNELGWVLQQQGDLRGAAKHFRRAAAVRSDFAEAKRRLAHVEALLAAEDGRRAGQEAPSERRRGWHPAPEHESPRPAARHKAWH